MKIIITILYLIVGCQLYAQTNGGMSDHTRGFRKIHTGIINVYMKQESYSIRSADGRSADNHKKLKYYIQKGADTKLKLLNRRNLLAMIKNENTTLSELDLACIADLKKVKRNFKVAKILISTAAVAGIGSYMIFSPAMGSKNNTSIGSTTTGQILGAASAGVGIGTMITSYGYYYNSHKDVLEILSRYLGTNVQNFQPF